MGWCSLWGELVVRTRSIVRIMGGVCNKGSTRNKFKGTVQSGGLCAVKW